MRCGYPLDLDQQKTTRHNPRMQLTLAGLLTSGSIFMGRVFLGRVGTYCKSATSRKPCSPSAAGLASYFNPRPSRNPRGAPGVFDVYLGVYGAYLGAFGMYLGVCGAYVGVVGCI